MNGFLVEVEGNNLQRGTETTFYFRDTQTRQTQIRHMPVQDYVVSKNRFDARANGQPAFEAEALQEALAPYGAEIVRSGHRKHVVSLYAPRETKHDPNFITACERYRDRWVSDPKKQGIDIMESYPQVNLNLRFPVLSRMVDDVYKRRERMTVPELEKETYCAIDIEVEDYDTDHPTVFMVSVISNTQYGNRLFTLRETDRIDEDLEIELLGQRRTVRIEKVGTQGELVKRTADFIRQVDPLYLFGHNIMSFDLDYLRNSGEFNIGVDGSRPKANTGPIGYKMNVTGRYVIDSLPFARNNFWLPDYKLETLARYLGIPFEKSFHGEELRKAIEESRHNPVAARELARYNFMDTAVSERVSGYFLPFILRAALAFWTDPTTACYTSKVEENYYDHRQFMDLRTFRKDFIARPPAEGQQTEFEFAKTEEPNERRVEYREPDFDIDERKFAELRLHTAKTGIMGVRALYVPLFLSAFWRRHTSQHFPDIRMEGDADAVNRTLALKMEEKALTRILRDLYNDNVSPGNFFGKYGIGRDKTKAAIKDRARKFQQILSKGKVVNAAGPFVFVEDDDTVYEGVWELGHGKAISLGRGRLVANIGDGIISPGVDLRGSIDKTDYERRFVETIVRSVLIDDDLAYLDRYARDRIADLITVNDDRNSERRRELVYGNMAHLDWFEYSYRALTRESVKFAEENELMAGESVRRGYLKRTGRVKEDVFLSDMTDDIDLRYYLKKMFGVRLVRGRLDATQVSGTLGQFLSVVFKGGTEDLFPDRVSLARQPSLTAA